MIGIWGMLHFVLFFLMLGAVFQIKKEWLNLLKISVGVSSLVALLAIIQKFTSLGLLIPQTERVFGTIGNAGFLGTYLIFNIFFAAYLLFEAILSRRKILFAVCPAPSLLWCGVYCALLIVNCLALFFTGTRGAILGLLAGIIVFLLLWATKNFYFLWKSEKNLTSQPPFKRGARGVKIPAIILLTIIVFIGLLFLARDSAFVKNNSVLSRLTAFSLSDTTTQNRLLLWGGAWQAWQEKPILGWGPENFEIAANKYFDSRLAPYEAWYDRAHNFIFDYGVWRAI
ncbi:MAG: Uncharacterized protein LiPW39_509 [Parcubacteria group bacterium LiPW_39]|nr:MAG: Uncharacterized protein LiPW39_509 [Parcubacteria group bacterium LiPW_39]